MANENEFRSRHANILSPIIATIGSDLETLDQAALQENYTEHLVSLGLLTRPLQIDPSTGQPVFDHFKKDWKTQSTQTTRLGKLLLRHIGLVETQ